MNNRQVGHCWAQQNGKDGKSSNFYSCGPTIYSYGPHFPVARFYGTDVVLLTDRNHSVSTAKHINYTRQAIPASCTIFYVANPDCRDKRDHVENFDKLKKEALEIVQSLPKLRGRKGDQIARALWLVAHANEYAAHFKLGKRIRLKGVTEQDLQSLLAVQTEKEAVANRKREALRQAREVNARAEASEKLAAWLAGASEFPPQRYLDGIRFRLIGDDGATVQSTLGAEFPADHAKRAWPILQRIKASGQAWERNGQQIHLGHFQIDKIEPNGDIVAGCHRISWEEVVRVAGLLGLATEGAT